MYILQKIQLVVGICIVLSPWIFGYYEVTAARWINVILGLAVTLTALFELLGREDRESGNPPRKQI